MQKLMIFILLGWLTLAGVSAAPGPDKPGQADFIALNDYLVKNMPQNEEVAENLAYIESNKNQLASSVKEAGQMVLDLVATSGNICTNRVMYILLELQRSPLSPFGPKRINKLLGDSWTNAFEKCREHMRHSYEKSSGGETRFFVAYFLRGNRGPTWRESRDHRHLYETLRELVGHSSKPQFKFESKGLLVKSNDRNKFDLAFDEFLVRPCNRIDSEDEVLENMATITRLGKEQADRIKGGFWIDIYEMMERMNVARRVCSKIIDMNESLRTKVFMSAKI